MTFNNLNPWLAVALIASIIVIAFTYPQAFSWLFGILSTCRVQC